MIDDKTIQQALLEYYPNSRQITSIVVREIAEMCDKHGAEEDGFYRAIKAYREHDERYNFLPTARDLVKYIEKRTVTNPGKLWHIFINTVINNGWDVAVHTALLGKLGGSGKQCEAMKQLLIHSGIEENTVPYFGFPDWLQVFCRILHVDKDPSAAYSYAMYNAPQIVRSYYQQKHELLSRMSIEKQRLYFPVLRGVAA